MDITFIKDVIGIALVVSCIGFILAMSKMAIALNRYYKLKRQSVQNDIEFQQLEISNRNKTVDYSNQVLELLRSIIGQIAVLKFRTFKDTHDMDKITKANIENLIKEIAEVARKSLNMNNIFLDDTFFTKEFVDKYIIETSIILVKQMTDKAVDELTKDE